MSNKLLNKPSRKDRPRSSEKSGAEKRGAKKRDGGTPDKAMSPSGSSSIMPEPDMVSAQQSGKVIDGGDVQSLAISRDELSKIHVPKKPSVPRPMNTITVRRAKPKPPEPEPLVGRSVILAKPAPPDAAIVSTPLVGTMGPSFDEEGHFLEHSILGSLDDLRQEAEERQELQMVLGLSGSTRSSAHSTQSIQKTMQTSTSMRPAGTMKAMKRPHPDHVWKTGTDETKALSNWQKKMSERKQQQSKLSDRLGTRTDLLVMNQSEEYRQIQEERYLIDRCIPAMDYGKGYRVGSEFWKQVEKIGDDVTGISMTLTQTERGYPPPVEHVSKSLAIKNEMGIGLGSSTRCTVIHYPWEKSAYLKERKEQLQHIISEMDPHKPYFDLLQVIGQKPQGPEVPMETIQEEALSESGESLLNDPLASQKDSFIQPIVGPSLTIGGHLAQWTGSSWDRVGQVGVTCRVLFEAEAGKNVTSTLDLCNDGTTAIYYAWKKVPKVNKLQTVLAGKTQRFYFDMSSGVILPGDTLKFPFVFKSRNPGVFTETWQLNTQPVVCGGAAINVVLHGTAVQEDQYREAREAIERELERREAQQTIDRILEELLEGVRTPERARSPVDAYITDEEIFARKNEGMFFHNEVVQEMRGLYSQLDPEGVWDLDVGSLKGLIMGQEDEEQKDEMLVQLNKCVLSCAFAPLTPVQQKMFEVGYKLFCEGVDELVGHAVMIRQVMGLPEREMVEGIPEEVEKKPKKTVAPEAGKQADAKKGDKKDKKGGGKEHERPPSTKQSAKASAKPPRSRGPETPKSTSTVTPSSARIDKDGIERPGTAGSGEGSHLETADSIAELKYKEKLFVQAYSILSEMANRIDTLFTDLKEEDDVA